MSSIDEYGAYLTEDSVNNNKYKATGYDFPDPLSDPLNRETEVDSDDQHDDDDAEQHDNNNNVGGGGTTAAADDDEDALVDNRQHRHSHSHRHGNRHSSRNDNDDASTGEQAAEDSADDEELASFEFIISEPMKAGGKIGHHWVYNVTWKTTSSKYTHVGVQRAVKRRFSDFVWLRERLEKEYVGVIIPPLPEKSMLGTVEKFFSTAVDSKALLQYRQRALTKFMCRVAEHPLLQKSPTLQQFLEIENEAEFNAARSGKVENVQTPKSRTALGNLLKSKQHTKEPEWITQQKLFLGKLDESLKSLKLKLQDMVQRRKELSAAVSDFAKAFRHLGLVEKSYEEGSLCRSLLETSQKAESSSVCILSLANRETIQVIETLTYYLGMIESIKKGAAHLENLRYDRDDLTHQIKNQKVLFEKLCKQPGKEVKAKEAEKVVFDLEEKEKQATRVYDKAETQFRRDLQRFDMERRVDFSYMLSAFVQLQISSSVDNQNIWKAVEVIIDDNQPSESVADVAGEDAEDAIDAALDD